MSKEKQLIEAIETESFNKFKIIADTYSNEELANFEIPVKSGSLPILHFCAGSGYSDLMESHYLMMNYLLERGYDANKPDKNGNTALLYAIDQNNVAGIELLLVHKANPFVKAPGSKYNTLYDAMFDGNGNYRDFMYRHHKPYSKPTTLKEQWDTERLEFHLTRILKLCKPEFEKSCVSPSYEEKLIEAITFDPKKATTYDPKTGKPLDWMEQGQRDFNRFEEVINSTPWNQITDLHIPVGDNNIPALHYCAMRGGDDERSADHIFKVEGLLKNHCDVNKPDKNGYTALAYAISAGNLEIARILLHKGADPFVKSPWPKYKTLYDAMFDENGNYRDFAYSCHKLQESDKNSFGYKISTDELEERLKAIRDFCKPELSEKSISAGLEREGKSALEGIKNLIEGHPQVSIAQVLHAKKSEFAK